MRVFNISGPGEQLLQDEINGRLIPGERLIWCGRPGRGLVFTSMDVFLVPFSVVWCAFAIFWETSVLHTHAPGFFPIFGVPFLLLGFYLVFGRFIVDAWLRAATGYAITDRRVLIIRGGGFNSFVTLNVERLPEIRVSEKKNGRGTITFGTEPAYWARGFGVWTPSLDQMPRFLDIENVREVFDQIQRLANARK